MNKHRRSSKKNKNKTLRQNDNFFSLDFGRLYYHYNNSAKTYRNRNNSGL